jgi:hypothetical protein
MIECDVLQQASLQHLVRQLKSIFPVIFAPLVNNIAHMAGDGIQ